MAKIAFIGTGSMGKEMALHLVNAGHDVIVYNRTRNKAESLVHAGGTLAETPAAAAAGADYIFSMVSDDDASRIIWEGPAGVLTGAPNAGAVAIECSTLSYGWIRELNDTLLARGLRFMDCPVTGGPDGARAGTLKVLAGADTDTLNEATPVLNTFAAEIIHFGPVGNGSRYKLIVNLMGAVQAAALAEGLLISEQAGLDPDKVAYALSHGTVASPHVKYLVQRMIKDEHDKVYYPAGLRYKDALYALRLAEDYQLQLPASQAATELYRQAVAGGLGEKNSSIIIRVLQDLHKRINND